MILQESPNLQKVRLDNILKRLNCSIQIIVTNSLPQQRSVETFGSKIEVVDISGEYWEGCSWITNVLCVPYSQAWCPSLSGGATITSLWASCPTTSVPGTFSSRRDQGSRVWRMRQVLDNRCLGRKYNLTFWNRFKWQAWRKLINEIHLHTITTTIINFLNRSKEARRVNKFLNHLEKHFIMFEKQTWNVTIYFVNSYLNFWQLLKSREHISDIIQMFNTVSL